MRLNSTVAPQDEQRIQSQAQAILERLRKGPATSGQLAAISIKYTSRISDLRKNGYVIPRPKREWHGGFLYQLLES